MNLKHIARQHVGLPDVGQWFDPAIAAHHDVLADLPWLAAGHAEGTVFVAVSQYAGSHGF